MKPSRPALIVVILAESLGVLVVLGTVASLLFGEFTAHPARGGAPEASPMAASSMNTAAPSQDLSAPAAHWGNSPPAPTATWPVGFAIEAYPYIVQPGDTLAEIAFGFSVSVEDILDINPQISDPNAIQAGQQIMIPARMSATPTALPMGLAPMVTAAPSTAASSAAVHVSVSDLPDLQPYSALVSVISANPDRLATAYPLEVAVADGKLRAHYQPGAYTDTDQADVLEMLADVYAFVELQMGRPLGVPLDLYAAGSLFHQHENLRGFSQSGLYRIFLLVDGSGDRGDRSYLFGHELTHVFAFHQFGRPSSSMIHEGFATYLPQVFLAEQAGYMTLTDICATIHAAGRLTSVAEMERSKLDVKSQYFAGHIRSFINYNVSACFVKLLVDNYGREKLARVYSSGDYSQVYGRTLEALEADLRADLAARDAPINPHQFVGTIDRLASAFDDYFYRTSSGQPAQWTAYLALDSARLSLGRGDLVQAAGYVELYYALVEA